MTNDDYLYRFLIRLGATSFQASTLQFIIERPLKILFTILLALIAGRIVARFTRKIIAGIGTRAHLASSGRAPRRATAIGSTAAGISKVIVWVIAIPVLLGELGLNLGPFIAGATIIGAALGFGAQSLVKDVLSGFMILAEDQFAVGDTISLGDTMGTVEDVNLMRTRVRGDDGKVWFVANGEIRKVANSSLDWVRANVDVALPYDADLDAAMAMASDEARRFVAEPEWAAIVLDAPVVFSTDMTFESVAFRVTARTLPGQSVRVSRVLRGRVLTRIRTGGLDKAVATSEGDSDEPEPAPEAREAGVGSPDANGSWAGSVGGPSSLSDGAAEAAGAAAAVAALPSAEAAAVGEGESHSGDFAGASPSPDGEGATPSRQGGE